MKPIQAFWALYRQRIVKKRAVLFLDFDGTLSPIVKNPCLAHPPDRILRVLKSLQKKRNLQLAVVSGRDLPALKKFLPLRGLVLAGNHGAVIEGPGFRFLEPGARRFRSVLTGLERQVRLALIGFPGIRYEHKIYGLTIHYRDLQPEQSRRASRVLKRALSPAMARHECKMRTGKKVWELCPPESWGKGNAVLWLMKKFNVKHSQTLVVYIGDDVTDEDAFRVLRKRGAGIRVASGPSKKSAASFYLKSTKEVALFLETFSELS